MSLHATAEQPYKPSFFPKSRTTSIHFHAPFFSIFYFGEHPTQKGFQFLFYFDKSIFKNTMKSPIVLLAASALAMIAPAAAGDCEGERGEEWPKSLLFLKNGEFGALSEKHGLKYGLMPHDDCIGWELLGKVFALFWKVTTDLGSFMGKIDSFSRLRWRCHGNRFWVKRRATTNPNRIWRVNKRNRMQQTLFQRTILFLPGPPTSCRFRNMPHMKLIIILSFVRLIDSLDFCSLSLLSQSVSK